MFFQEGGYGHSVFVAEGPEDAFVRFSHEDCDSAAEEAVYEDEQGGDAFDFRWGILRFWATVATVVSMKVLVAPSSSATFFWVRLAATSWAILSAWRMKKMWASWVLLMLRRPWFGQWKVGFLPFVPWLCMRCLQ